jgi:hypothetical protein
VKDIVFLILSCLFCVALFIGLPVLILVLRDRISEALWRRRNPPEKLAADRRAYEERLLHPDWSFYERHLQRPAPQALRDLYADHALIVLEGVDYVLQSDDYSEDEVISTFGALDEQGLIETRPWLGFDAVAIATNDFGDVIYLRPGPAEPDIVYMTYHDGGDTNELAPDVSTFVQCLRDEESHANPARD